MLSQSEHAVGTDLEIPFLIIQYKIKLCFTELSGEIVYNRIFKGFPEKCTNLKHLLPSNHL